MFDRIEAWWRANAIDLFINLAIAVAIFIVGRMVAKALSGLAKRMSLRSGLDEALAGFVGGIAYAVLMTIVIIAMLDRLGVPTTSAVAVLGAAGLAIGLALQGSLSNFASGVMIVFFKPYKVGDVVTVGGVTGSVQRVEIFNTILHTPDNRVIIVPNSTVTGGVIENVTAQDTRRIDLVFGIGYDDDIKKAKSILENIVAAESRILDDPAPGVAMGELADSSVNFNVRPWVKTGDYWAVRSDLLEKVKLAFDEQGISIPYPQTDIHVHQLPAAQKAA